MTSTAATETRPAIRDDGLAVSALVRSWTIAVGVATVVQGVWAFVWPMRFYDDFPVPEAGWVSTLGPFNEHLARDFGSALAGLGVIAVLAGLSNSRAAVRGVMTGFVLFRGSAPGVPPDHLRRVQCCLGPYPTDGVGLLSLFRVFSCHPSGSPEGVVSNIFFTGATGVIGHQTIPELGKAGHQVTAVARNPDDHDWLRRHGARPVEVDLFDQLAVSAAVDGHDVVVHMATSIPPQDKMSKRKAWTMNDRLRAVATSILVDAALALEVEACVQQSVTFVYADGGDQWLDEDSPVDTVWDVLDSAVHCGRARGPLRSWRRTRRHPAVLEPLRARPSIT